MMKLSSITVLAPGERQLWVKVLSFTVTILLAPASMETVCVLRRAAGRLLQSYLDSKNLKLSV